MTKTRTVHIHDDSDIIRRLVRWKIPFTAEITGSTRILKVESIGTKYVCSDARMPFKTLGFIKQVKKSAEGAEERGVPDPNQFTSRDIDYFKFSRIMPGVYRDVIELDVNTAYWNIAKDLGYIDPQTHKKGMEVDKKDRLVAFGSLATVRHIYHFDGITASRVGEDKNDLTRSYFFHVAWELDKVMKRVFHLYEQHILWYWVDAFFLSKKVQGFVRSEVYKAGLDCKVKYVDEIEVFMQGRTKVIVVRMADGEEKPFFVKPVSELHSDLNRYTAIVQDIQKELEQRKESVKDTLKYFL